MDLRLFAVPPHLLGTYPDTVAAGDEHLLAIAVGTEALERALLGAEFRSSRAKDRIRALVSGDTPATHARPAEGFGASAVFAKPPHDLPALLRLADQLEKLATAEAGERALVWRCDSCNTRYAVPVALVRSVSIRCERCGKPVELTTDRSLGEEALVDSAQNSVNQLRRQLASFFREAMARGWPVLVAGATP